ncbi:MAG TPA: nitrate reductase molybdenum cofactor assembly chaperone [Solirubrobacterales bacterium]|nr:nitrate reductase molybdenum cofactor assembly chaperone [Solirubrobacterales bacterium]
MHPLKLASLLLQYPSPELREALRGSRDSDLGDERTLETLRPLLDHYRATPLAELQRGYVEDFDFTKRNSLHLTYHLHGDRRQRGVALLRLKQAYAAAGLEPSEQELPDYLPLMLEFSALAPQPAGAELLGEHRVAIELVRRSLREQGSPWAAPLELVAGALPGLTRRQLGRLRRLAAEGPPTEQVGLEPFAPPEVMPQPGGPPGEPLVGGIGT